MVQVVSEELSASITSMAVIDSEEGALGPDFVLTVLWLHDVEDDGDSVLVVIPDETLVSIGGIPSNNSGPLIGGLSWVIVWYDYLMCRLNIHDLLILWHDIAFAARSDSKLFGAWRALRRVPFFEIEILFRVPVV